MPVYTSCPCDGLRAVLSEFISARADHIPPLDTPYPQAPELLQLHRPDADQEGSVRAREFCIVDEEGRLRFYS